LLDSALKIASASKEQQATQLPDLVHVNCLQLYQASYARCVLALDGLG
jgi:hypothetical protein